MHDGKWAPTLATTTTTKTTNRKSVTSSKQTTTDNRPCFPNKIALYPPRGTAPLQHSALDRYSQAWACASSWRPHKRLSENIRYFHEHAPETACLVVAGDVSQVIDSLQGVRLDRVLFAGDLDHDTLTSLYRRSTHLLHLAWLDHCPNVVVDARAAGCRIVCASSGGTEEVAGLDAVVVEEDAWDLTPLDLYTPPSLNFSRSRPGRIDHTNDMRDVSQMYRAALMEIAG